MNRDPEFTIRPLPVAPVIAIVAAAWLLIMGPLAICGWWLS